MARSATGALRAVKVVWRADYDHPEGFEREFEALKHYEPVSRKHAGLVPILQVGRSDTEGFYYYVMELADDLDKGRDINAETYRSHTLGAQMRRDKRLTADQCVNDGASVAEGLHYLHRNKLIHRDIKPSNLIYINGQCALADIGLVTLLGQRTFVGTEGFVAPEGPGSAASDIFSLGMVLYEASTGKDRLDFPELPSYRETGADLKVWRRLQDVICTACATKVGQRYENAMEMSLALRGKPLPSHRRRMLIAGGAVAALVCVAIGMWIAHNERRQYGVVALEHQAKPLLTLRSKPDHAQVYAGEEMLGETPLDLNPLDGVPTIYQLRLPGYKHYELEHTSEAGKPIELSIKLERSRLPQAGERWTNSLGMTFIPRQGTHITPQPVEIQFFRKFVESNGRPFEFNVLPYQPDKDKSPAYIVVGPIKDAEAFRYWLTERDRRDGWLSQEHHYEIEPFYYVETKAGTDDGADSTAETKDSAATTASGTDEKDWQAFNLRVVRQAYGSVTLKTQPAGVHVYQHDELLGDTPLEIPRVRSGPVEYELRKDEFTDLVVDGEVKEGEILDLYADMEVRRGVIYGREWHNSQGMRFMPLGEILMAVWETRRRDFLEYSRAIGHKMPAPVEDTGKSGTQPIAGIDREEARSFCLWLTQKEHNSRLIGPDDLYRLPTDEEWSRAVGLPMEHGATPQERSGRIRGIYPWGYQWPPPDRVDNLADMQAAKKAGLDNVITGFTDQAPFTAAVTSLPPNDRGLCGLGGNVSEWVDTDFEKAPASGAPPMATVRGGNWRTFAPEEALSSTRTPVPANTRRNTIGFRLVLCRK